MQTWSQKLKQLEWPFWIGFVFFIAVIGCCVHLMLSANDWLKDKNQLPIQYLVVEGDLTQVNHQMVLTALKPQMQSSFVGLDVNAAQASVENLDWVYWAAIRKEWPNTIKVNLVEQKAKAKWNDDFLLNHLGEVFKADASLLANALPNLHGPDDEASSVLKHYEDFSALLALHDMKAVKLTITDRHSVQITLDNGIELKLGRENWLARIKRFLEFYPRLAKQHQIQYVDLRYDTGFAVGELKQKATITG
ncbi:cell division protein FtsQ/DivIB [Catenovulum sp. 2E275]|uniref:cell division protein FtsQ/DivIB n=1 Tax=Catenovulum sp. 2E275 TaxID=2980497 RepID=UPI0021CF5FCC|nr:cell division protein FtsQ/DivIB [Catenovulum sp. 2E275]MCU4674210.1 cell division protein FtsQ/DivIB [Catenovulum sp. 2E275]